MRPWLDIDREIIRRILSIGAFPALGAIARNGVRVVYLALLGIVPLGASMHAAVGVGLQDRLIGVLPSLPSR